MTDARRLLERAADCYEQAGLPLEAARCRERAGTLHPAAVLYERGGDLERAADCYARARLVPEAVSCWLRLGRVEEAAGCWEQAGDVVSAAWVLVTAGRNTARARWLVDGDRAEPGVRRTIVRALCRALEGGGHSALRDALAALDHRQWGTPQRWAVEAADLVGRPDLAAQVFADAYAGGHPAVLVEWREWAERALGGTAGLPRGAA